MEKLKVIIIDDEQNARLLIENYLKKYDQFQIIEQCDNGFDGVMAIKKLQPDLIFLDIQMPKLTGFEVLEVIDEAPMIIFTTAYDEYAIKAFEFNTIDYLLKPFSQKRFDKAMNKVVAKKMTLAQDPKKLNEMVAYVRNQDEIIHRIVVKTKGGIEIIRTSQIERIEAQDDYVFIFTDENKRYIKQITMKYLETHLDAQEFVRVHRSHIVRVGAISKLNQQTVPSPSLLMKSGVEVPISRTGMIKLKSNLKL